MSKTEWFLAYAAAFEQAYETGEWSALEPFFTEDAVYEVQGNPPFGGRWEGRDAVLAYFNEVLDSFDRRFPTKRVLEFPLGLVEDAESVKGPWECTYVLSGAPDLLMLGEEQAWFSGERIQLLVDKIPPEVTDRVVAYVMEHGEALGMEGAE